MKGVLQPDHIPLNNYQLRVRDLPDITFVSIGGLEKELENVDLPDRTAASGGHTKAGKFVAKVPLHHLTEIAALEQWLEDSKDPVAPDYKKSGTLIFPSISGNVRKQYVIVGLFPCLQKGADVEMSNEGEEHEQEWTFRYDDYMPT